ncbi:MAG: MmgE/PrpD family protein [Hyphomicrobiaceae bacterium]|nr:MmgE/PrpD family protein [Hyphomicrobiaceae bacterium]
MTPSQELACFAAQLHCADIPTGVLESAKRHLLDAIGLGVLGSAQPMPRNALAGILAMPGAAGSARVWGTATTLAAPYAALANGIACHAADFDDTHTVAIVHGSAILAPTLLALGEHHGSSGSDVLAAFVAGWEVAARIGIAARGTIHRQGYHTTSIAGVFGAAVAAGKLLGLSHEEMAHAMGLAGSQASGINEYQINGSSAKILHTGWAAHAGIVAAYLAKGGMTGPLTVLEGGAGILATHGLLADSDTAALTRGLGRDWEMSMVSIKPYPCCHFLHGFIDCALGLRRHGIAVGEIDEIEAIVPAVEVPFICEPAALRAHPVTPYIAKFSLPLTVAAALIDGAVDHKTFTSDYLRREDALTLAKRVRYRVAGPDETTFPTYYPGWLRMRLRDGRLLEERLDINRGSPGNPLSQDEVARKWRENADGVLPPAAIDELLAAVSSMERKPIAAVVRCLAAAAAH